MDASENYRLVQLERENSYLKSRCKLLEDKCRDLEAKISCQDSRESTSHINTYLSDTTNAMMRNSKKDANKSTSSSSTQNQPKPVVYPPLRVRLQKLNEKSVALKWNHNPKNALVDLSGYNIYINDDLLATMGPTDKIASIDGMKDEGEYRICIKAICSNVESEASNTVITRVKKKPNDGSSNTSSL